MTDQLMLLAYLGPMTAVLGLFWNVARKLGGIEVEIKQLREQNRNLRAEVSALRDLLSIVVDSRRLPG
jgi:hypothetical protein